MLIPIHEWAAIQGISERRARRYVDLGRISGAIKSYASIDVPYDAVVLPVSDAPVALPQFLLTPGQQRVREILRRYRKIYQEYENDTDIYKCDTGGLGLIKQIKAELTNDLIITEDSITGHDTHRPNYHRGYLSFLSTGAEQVRDTKLDVHLRHFVDVNDRHGDRLLGVKYDSTIAALLRLDSGAVQDASGVDVTVFPEPGIVWITFGGAHRSLANMLFGAPQLSVSSAWVVHKSVDEVINKAALDVEAFLLIHGCCMPNELSEKDVLQVVAVRDYLTQFPERSIWLGKYLDGSWVSVVSVSELGELQREFSRDWEIIHGNSWVSRVKQYFLGRVSSRFWRAALLPMVSSGIGIWYRERLIDGGWDG